MADTQTIFKLGEEYKLSVRKALRLLGKRNLSLIIHGASFPSVDEQDIGFGTFTSEGAKNLIAFSKDIFSSIQLGPAGKTKAIDSSPYTSHSRAMPSFPSQLEWKIGLAWANTRGKSGLPFELRRKAGYCSRATAGPIDLI